MTCSVLKAPLNMNQRTNLCTLH